MAELYGKIVLPGEEVEKNEFSYKLNNKFISKKVSLISKDEEKTKVISLSSTYYPEVGDKVIGIVKEVEAAGWFVDINSINYAFLPIAEAVKEFIDIYRTDLSKIININEIIYAKVINVINYKIIQISLKDDNLRKLNGGGIISVNPAKVARIIGKNMSMIKLISEKTNCEIIVGKNGYIWIKSKKAENMIKAINAIKFIERNSHFKGLTEMVMKYLEEK
ncbi:MAG: exosome complex RNA-binding protein Rrp4 [Candidatus Aenigmatarchaeota archaeon]